MGSPVAETVRAMRTCLENVAYLRERNAPQWMIDREEHQAREYREALDRLLALR